MLGCTVHATELHTHTYITCTLRNFTTAASIQSFSGLNSCFCI